MQLYTNCLKCGKKVSRNCKSGYCNSCRDRSGKNNPMYGKSVYDTWVKKFGKEKADKMQSEMLEKNKIASQKLWEQDEYREKVIKGISKPRKESFKKEQSERIKQWYIDNPEQKIIRSNSMKKSWENGNLKPNSNSMSESKMEIEIRNDIKNLTELNVCKKTIKIGKKWLYPDVVIGDNLIIEFYVDYWHAHPEKFINENEIVHHNISAKTIRKNDEKRLNLLKENGYCVYIVWEKEYINNKDETLNKIKEWINENKN